MKYHLVINLRTANMLKHRCVAMLLARADEVIGVKGRAFFALAGGAAGSAFAGGIVTLTE